MLLLLIQKFNVLTGIARTPTVCWHGVNDHANSSCSALLKVVDDVMPGVFTMSIKIGDSLQMDTMNSVLMSASDQVNYACNIIANNPNLSDGYNALGISQGGLMLRGVAQRCPKPPMKNLITFGSPHQGIFGIPKCQSYLGYSVCQMLTTILSSVFSLQWIQKMFTPAQYWHDPFNQPSYVAGSQFLADINNEREEKNQSYKQALLALKNLVLVKWTKDTSVIPRESSQFGFYNLGGDNTTITLQEMPLYQRDWLGLQAMKIQGRLHFKEVEGDHMLFTRKWFINNIIIPFLR